MKPLKYICCGCSHEPIIFTDTQDLESPECPNCEEADHTIPLHYLEDYPNTYQEQIAQLNKYGTQDLKSA